MKKHNWGVSETVFGCVDWCRLFDVTYHIYHSCTCEV